MVFCTVFFLKTEFFQLNMLVAKIQTFLQLFLFAPEMSSLNSALLWLTMLYIGVSSPEFISLDTEVRKLVTLNNPPGAGIDDDDDEKDENFYSKLSTVSRLSDMYPGILEKLAPFLKEEDWLMNDAALLRLILLNDYCGYEEDYKRILVDNEHLLVRFNKLMEFKLSPDDHHYDHIHLFGRTPSSPLKVALRAANRYFDRIPH